MKHELQETSETDPFYVAFAIQFLTQGTEHLLYVFLGPLLRYVFRERPLLATLDQDRLFVKVSSKVPCTFAFFQAADLIW